MVPEPEEVQKEKSLCQKARDGNCYSVSNRPMKECEGMSEVKNRIIGAVTVMNEDDAAKVWEMIQSVFVLSNAEEVPPEDDELAAIHAYQNGSPEYQPSATQEKVICALGIRI